MNCSETLPRIWEYLDGELDPTLLAPFERHLTVCRVCWLAYRFDGTFLRRIAVVAVRAPAPEPLRARVRETLGRT
jgi:anti-sigma factor (TIGR02949 family)